MVVTDTAPKRVGLSCAIVGFFVAAGMATYAFDATHMRRIGNDNVETERAERFGLGVQPMKRQLRIGCEARFGGDPFTVQNCLNSELFGDFGEVGERAYSLMKLKYAFGSAALAILAAAGAWFFGWALVAFVVPGCRQYWGWLRGTS
jgi:hypothetical protein